MINMWIISLILVYIGGTHQILFPEDNHNKNSIPKFCKVETHRTTCDCEGDVLQLQESMANNKHFISITNCKSLSISPNSLKNTGPIEIVLQNINDLQLFESSFQIDEKRRPHISLSIINTTINNIPSYAFSVVPSESRVLTGIELSNVNKILLQLTVRNSTINDIEPNAFGNIKLRSISIINSVVNSIQGEAINNLLTSSLKIVNTTFIQLAKNAITIQDQETTVELHLKGNIFPDNLQQFLVGTVNGDVNIINNKFSTLNESPWDLQVKNEALIDRNEFANIPKNGIQLGVHSRITMSHNIIHKLQGNALQNIIPKERDTAIFLNNNTIYTFEPMSLCLNQDFNGGFVAIKNNLFHQTCDCTITKAIADGLGNRTLTTEVLYNNKVHKQWLIHGICLLRGKKIELDLFVDEHCTKHRLAMILLLTFAAILIILATCVIVAWRRIKYKNTVQGHDSDYQSFSAPAPSSLGHTPWSLVQPDSRTYQETEIHVVFDNATEIKDMEDVSPEKEDSFEHNNQREKENHISGKNTTEVVNSEIKKERVNTKAEKSLLLRKSCPPIN